MIYKVKMVRRLHGRDVCGSIGYMANKYFDSSTRQYLRPDTDPFNFNVYLINITEENGVNYFNFKYISYGDEINIQMSESNFQEYFGAYLYGK